MKDYHWLRARLRSQTKNCRSRDIRVKAELMLLAARLGNVSEACGRRGFSRQFYYKWWRRLERSGFDIRALGEKSRRPRRSPRRTKSYWEVRVRSLAKVGYGARMIEALLKREDKGLHRSTICHILNRRERVKRVRRERLKAHRRRYELPIPGLRLQLDVKYVPELVEGFRAFNYVAIDECTRWRFAWAYLDLTPANTVDFLERLWRACPFPIHTLQTDNGLEFTYRFVPSANHVTHPMDEWCQAHQIRHRLIPPGEKEINGKVERSHRIDEQYFYWQAPTDSLARFNAACATWLAIYNRQRPHGGVGYLTPQEKLMERYQTLRQATPNDKYEQERLQFIRELPKRLPSPRQLTRFKAAA